MQISITHAVKHSLVGVPVDPYRFPCHPDLRIDPETREWKGIGLAPEDGVTRSQIRCPSCKAHYNAFRRSYGDAVTVEWICLRPFAVTAAALPGVELPVWQDAQEPLGQVSFEVPGSAARQAAREASPQGNLWTGATQLVTVVQPMTAQSDLVAEPGELLLESRRPWVANDRRLALLWSLRLHRPVVAWHSFARLPDN